MKPRQLPYVFVDIEAEGGGNVAAVHAICTLHAPEAPSPCPWARYYVEPPRAGEPCVWHDGGDCHCREILREGMRRIRDYIGAELEEADNGCRNDQGHRDRPAPRGPRRNRGRVAE